MKNILKRCLAMIVAMVVYLSLTACSGGGTSSGDGEKVDLAGTTVKLLLWTTPTNSDEQLFDNFEQATGINLDVTVTGWDDCWVQLVNSVAAGDSYDVTMVSGFPQQVTRGLFQPIDKWWDKDDPKWSETQMEWYEWEGKHYAFGSIEAASTTFSTFTPVYAYYNKDMLMNAGLEDPLQLEAEGRWDWENFKRMLKELTVDTNYDGKLDQWGLSSGGYQYHYLTSNDTYYCRKDDKGKWVLNFDDPALAEVLDFIVEINKKYGGGTFSAGTACFYMGGDTGVDSFAEDELDFDWDFINVPYGPNNTEKKASSVMMQGLGIIAGAKNPDGAAELIKYLLDAENAVDTNELVSEVQRERIRNSKKHCAVISPGFDYHSLYSILPAIQKGESAASVLKSAKSQWEYGILKSYEGTGIVTMAEGKPFAGMDKITFEDGTMGPLRVIDEEAVTATITTNPDEVAAEQYSLVLSSSKTSTDFVEIDPSKIPLIEPGNYYTVTVTYRILEDFGNNGYGFMKFGLVDQDNTVIGDCGEISGSKGDIDTATVEIQYIDTLKDVRLKFTGEHVGKVAIDDISIISHK